MDSGAPIAFLQLEKALVTVLGISEAHLRVLPFLASILALIAVAMASERILPAPGPLVAVLLVAILPVLIDYAGIVKQYSSDVAIVAVLVLVGLWAIELPLTLAKAACLAGMFALTPLLSHPGAAVAASAVCILVLAHVLDPRARRTSFVVGVATSCAAIAGLAAAVFLVSLHGIASGLAGGGIDDLDELRDFVGAVRLTMGVGRGEAGFPAVLVGFAAVAMAGAYLGGLIVIWRRRWEHCLRLVLPLALACVGMVVGIYPHEVRTLLFAAPLVVIPVGGGIGPPDREVGGRGGIRCRCVGHRLLCPAQGVLDVLARVSRDDDRMRAAMTYLAGHQRNGDRVYAWYTSQYPLAFLLECECLPDTLRSAARRWPVEPVEGSSDQWAPAPSREHLPS